MGSEIKCPGAETCSDQRKSGNVRHVLCKVEDMTSQLATRFGSPGDVPTRLFEGHPGAGGIDLCGVKCIEYL